jgi:hypothetical protein
MKIEHTNWYLFLITENPKDEWAASFISQNLSLELRDSSIGDGYRIFFERTRINELLALIKAENSLKINLRESLDEFKLTILMMGNKNWL